MILLSAVSIKDDSLSVRPSVSLWKRYNDDIIYNYNKIIIIIIIIIMIIIVY